MGIEGADTLFAAFELDGQDAFAAESIALPDFPYGCAGGKRAKFRSRSDAPSCRLANKGKEATPGSAAAALDAGRNPIGSQAIDQAFHVRGHPDFLQQHNIG